MSNAVTISESSTDGLRTWTTAYGMSSETRTVYAGSGNRYMTNTAADGSRGISHYLHGELQSVTRMSGDTQLSKTTYTYDAHGPTSMVIDARNGATTYTYDNADRRVSVTTPQPATGQGRQTTSYTFDSSGRITRTVHPDGTSTTNEYYATGEFKKNRGSRVRAGGNGDGSRQVTT